MIATAIGTAVLALLAAWLFGSLLLRLAGALLILAGATELAGSGEANGALVLGIGALLWWTGHLLYALRHGAWKSALAERLGGAALAVWHHTHTRLAAEAVAHGAPIGRENASQDEIPRGD
jgi:hypothetical protein